MQLVDVKPAMAKRKVVNYNGGSYYISAVIMRIHPKEIRWWYQLELQSMRNKNSVTIADMEKVKLEG